MSALRKTMSFLGYGTEEAEQAYDEDYETVGHTYDQYTRESEDAVQAESYETFEAYDEEAVEAVAVPDLRRIVTVHPSTYNEARVIGEAFRDGVPVIVNLTGMSESDARRMVDFSAGLVFGLHGAIERVTPRVFLLTPVSVEIDGGEAAELRGRFFNQS